MNAAVAAALGLSVAATWLAALTFGRLRPLSRVHAVAFVNVAGGGAMTLATWLAEGVTPRTAKVLAIWAVMLLTGALSAHVTGRAILHRGGDRR